MRDAAKLTKLNPAKSEPRERKEAVPETVSFSDLGLSDEVMLAVQELGLTEPTEVQALGIPAVLAGENVAMASHTGSGKTLAYMLPIVQVLLFSLLCPLDLLLLGVSYGTTSFFFIFRFCCLFTCRGIV